MCFVRLCQVACMTQALYTVHAGHGKSWLRWMEYAVVDLSFCSMQMPSFVP